MLEVDWRQNFGGLRYRVTPEGVEVEGDGVQRTRGEPVTIRRVMDHLGDQVLRAARETDVPVQLLLMTIGTEAGPITIQGDRLEYAACRLEPGFVTEERTPGKISLGPCHVLLSTGRGILHRPELTAEELADPELNIRAAARFIAGQAHRTDLDPVRVAAAYNAGSLRAVRPGDPFFNRWHLACWTGPGYCHLDQAVKWYGDACAVVKERLPAGPWPVPAITTP